MHMPTACLQHRTDMHMQHMPTAHACSVHAACTHRRTCTRACMDARTHTNTHAHMQAHTHERTNTCTGMRCVPPIQGLVRAGMEQWQCTVSCGVGCQDLEQTAAIYFCTIIIYFRAQYLCALGHTVSLTPTFRAGEVGMLGPLGKPCPVQEGHHCLIHYHIHNF